MPEAATAAEARGSEPTDTLLGRVPGSAGAEGGASSGQGGIDGDGFSGDPPGGTGSHAPSLADVSLSRTTAELMENGGSVPIRLEVVHSDAEGDVDAFTVALSTGATIELRGASETAGAAERASFVVEVPTAEIGSVTIDVWAMDKAGNKSNTVSRSFMVKRGTALASLALSAGELSPAFDSTVTSYTSVVPYIRNTVTVVAQSADAGATLRIDGEVTASGSPSGPIQLIAAKTIVTIVVEADHSNQQSTYTVEITRESAANVWVATDEVIRLMDSFGTELVTVTSAYGKTFEPEIGTETMAADPIDGGLWIADPVNNRVVKLDHAGTPILDVPLSSPLGIWADPRDGSVWTSELVTDATDLVKIGREGAVLTRVRGFSSIVWGIAGDTSVGNIWVADRMNNAAVVLREPDLPVSGYDASAPSGPAHTRIGGFFEPQSVAIAPASAQGGAAVWVANRFPGAAVKLSPAGVELARLTPSVGWEVRQVEFDPVDGSLWARLPSEPVVRFAADGTEQILRQDTEDFVQTIELDTQHRVVWVGAGLGAYAYTVDGGKLLGRRLPAIDPNMNAAVRDIEIQMEPR